MLLLRTFAARAGTLSALLFAVACAAPADEPPAEARDDLEAADESALSEARAPGTVDQTPPIMVNGIAIDSQGNLWVANGLGSELLQLDGSGKTILARYGRAQGVDGPDDLALDDDYVYYTANFTLAGAVGRLDRKTGKARTLANTGLGTNPIVRLPSGRLLAGITLGASGGLASLLNLTGLYEVDPTGATPAKRIVKDSKGINAFCVAPDGYAYGPALNSVYRIDLKTGASKLLRNDFGFAASVRYNPRDQQLYVLDVAPPAHPTKPLLYRMSVDGKVEKFAVLSEQKGAILPVADNFAIGEDGTFYVTRFLQPVISRVSADGQTSEDIAIGQR